MINNTYKGGYRKLPGPPGPGGPPGVAPWLFGELPDPQDGDALAWLEGLPAVEADAALDVAILEWADLTRAAALCPTCCSAIFYRLADGHIVCGNCDPPTGVAKAEKLVCVDDPTGPRWGNHATELAAQQTTRQGNAYELGEMLWDDAVKPEFCSTCGGCLWWDGAGRPHCERCSPPNRQELIVGTARHLFSKAKGRTRA